MEETLLLLAEQFLETDKGKELLGESINTTDILNRIREIAKEYDLDLSNLEKLSEEEFNLELGSNLTREQRKERRRQRKLSPRQRLLERINISQELDNLKEGASELKDKAREEIAALKAKLKSQIPVLQEFTITGRLLDKLANTPLQGAKVKLGVNEDVVGEAVEAENPLGVDSDYIPKKIDADVSNLIFLPILGQETITDDQGEFEIKVKVPIIPANQKTPLVLALLYSKKGYLPTTQLIINGDKTIRTDLPLKDILNIKEASKELAQEFRDGIDQAQSIVAGIGLSTLDKVVYAKKFSLGKLSGTLKTKLLPIAVSLLLAFGIAKASQANRKVCPTGDQLLDVINTRNRLVRQLNQIFQTIVINTALAAAFAALAKVLKATRIGMDNISIPQAFGTPPGPAGGLAAALPYSFTAKLQHINDELEKLEGQNQEVSKATLVSLVLIIAAAIVIILLLKTIDKMTQECIQENAGPNGVTDIELEAINQELLDLAEEQEEDGNPVLSNVNGFILSVETDNQNPVGTLKRRFAVAKDARGVTLLKGEPSFSSSDQILIDELVFYIQQNNLKA